MTYGISMKECAFWGFPDIASHCTGGQVTHKKNKMGRE